MRLRIITFFCLLCCSLAGLNSIYAQIVAIVGVNENPPDGFSFVALEDLPANTRIYFTTEEYDDGNNRFCDNIAAPCDVQEEVGYWESMFSVPAGTVISITEGAADVLTVACSMTCNGQPINANGCGTVTLTSPFFSLGTQDELYLYADSDDNPGNGVTNIYSVAYWSHGSTSNGGAIILPTADDPIDEFPDVIRLDGFPNDANSGYFEFTVALRANQVDKPALENPANYTVGTNASSPALNVTCFSNVGPADPCAGQGGDSDNDGVCDNNDGCPTDPNKTAPGICGCNVMEADANSNATIDCLEPPKAAIVGVNENDPDGFSFVALENLPVGTRIYFTSEEYLDGTGSFSPGGEEVGYFQATSVIAAGTVVVIKEVAANVLSADCCGTVTLVSGNFTFGDQDEIYLYLDNDTNPSNGVTNIYSVVYYNHNTVGSAPLPAANDPSGEFPNVYILDNLADSGTAGQFEYTVNLRGCGFSKAQLENPANYTLGTANPSPDLSSVDFVPNTGMVSGGGTICAGNPSTVTVTFSGGAAPYTYTLNNGGGTAIGASPLSKTVTPSMTTTYSVTSASDANNCSITVTGSATVTVNPLQNAAFAYANSGYCQAGADPSPTIYGVPGGTFSAPAQVAINASSGQIDVSASTAGGPYTITYTTPGPCPGSSTFNVFIVNCTPGATLTDAIITDNGQSGKADPGDRIKLTATISNSQSADYEGVQLTLSNDSKVNFVADSFKSTPVAADDTYLATMNMQLIVAAGSGVLQNDFEDNIPGLTVTAFDAMSAQGGTVMVNADGSFTYNPPNGFTGNDSFNYTVTDSDMQTNSGTVKIRVQ